jgi:DNA-binding PadR family transcriptional regulator
MSTRLVILGFLRERPLYGYELKSIIEEHMGDWTNIAFGSIYFALAKLADEGFIEKVATEQAGNRPSRSIYQITDSGREEFLRLLRQVWQNFERQFFAFDIGIFFMEVLPQEEIMGYLKNRVTQLEMILSYLDEHQSEEVAREEVPALATAIFDHTRVHMQAELAWTQEVLAKVESSEYP